MENEPWFTWYRAPGMLRIVPRNGKGWLAFFALLLLMLAPLVPMIAFGRERPWLLLPLFLWMTGVVVFAIRFARRHAEVIDLAQIARDLKEFREWRDREKPGR